MSHLDRPRARRSFLPGFTALGLGIAAQAAAWIPAPARAFGLETFVDAAEQGLATVGSAASSVGSAVGHATDAALEGATQAARTLADLGQRAWRSVEGPTGRVGQVVTDASGALVGYDVARGERALMRATPANGLLEIGERTVVHFRNAGAEIGTVVIDPDGALHGELARTLTADEARHYAYRDGAIVLADLAHERCVDVIRLTGQHASGLSLPRVGDVALDRCGVLASEGFACAVPGAVDSLLASTDRLYGRVRDASMAPPCAEVLVPPANLVCGAAEVFRPSVDALASCVLRSLDAVRLRFPNELVLGDDACRAIGRQAFGIALDAAREDGVEATRRVAELIALVFRVNHDVRQIEALVSDTCGEFSAYGPTTGDAPRRGLVLHSEPGFAGRTRTVDTNLDTLPGPPTRSITVPPGAFLSIYSEPGFAGVCDSIGSSMADLGTTNVGPGHVASIRLDAYCPGSPVLRLHGARTRGSRRVEVARDVRDLGAAGFDDAAVVAERLAGAGSPAVAFYTEPGFRGTCWELPRGTAGTTELEATPIRAGRLSSIRVGRGCTPSRP